MSPEPSHFLIAVNMSLFTRQAVQYHVTRLLGGSTSRLQLLVLSAATWTRITNLGCQIQLISTVDRLAWLGGGNADVENAEYTTDKL